MVHIFGTGGGRRTAEEQGIKYLGNIPLDPALVALGDAGRSMQAEKLSSPVTKAFHTLAEEVVRRNRS
ncbi:P-loop NTPase [Desulfobacter latus]|uniref:P-loop NTPase n=1 Tax=Desulfobacter latus TaxID=2292 RepID=UPI0031B61E29